MKIEGKTLFWRDILRVFAVFSKTQISNVYIKRSENRYTLHINFPKLLNITLRNP